MNIPPNAAKDHLFHKIKEIDVSCSFSAYIYHCSNCKINLCLFINPDMPFITFTGRELTKIINECKFYYYYPNNPTWFLVKDLFDLSCAEILIKDIIL